VGGSGQAALCAKCEQMGNLNSGSVARVNLSSTFTRGFILEFDFDIPTPRPLSDLVKDKGAGVVHKESVSFLSKATVIVELHRFCQ